MNRDVIAYAIVGAAALAIPTLTKGQPNETQASTHEDLVRQIERLAARLQMLEGQHEQDQQRIQHLEDRLRQIEQAPPIPPATPAPPQPPPSTGLFGLSGTGYGPTNELNPSITAFIETGASISSDGSNDALNRFNLREVELDLRTAISPSADGVLIVALGEEIEETDDGIDIDREVDVEEGFIHFHTLPHDLSLKIGKFRSAFGRNNLLHTHDLPQVTRPLALTSFLGPEGLSSIGASVGWLVPNPWDKFIETTVQVINADGGAESPVLGGPNAENPAVLAHVKFFDDLTETSSFEIGGTYLYGKTSADEDFDANVFGLDLTYQWVDPDPSRFRSLLLQSELFWAHNDVENDLFGPRRGDSFGAYAFAQYQLHRDWYLGLRADYTEFPNSETRGPDDWDFALSPYVTWYITEFLRARLEYQHRIFDEYGDRGSEEAVFLQFTGVIGAHPPHPYWVHR